MNIEKTIVRLFDEGGIKLNGKQISQFQTYHDVLLEWNKKMNLTAIVEPEEVVRKHFLDCALLVQDISNANNQRIIDVGSGAGFPGVVLAILRPDISLTCLDGLQKRIRFLTHLSDVLGLANIDQLIHGRAEDFARDDDHRETYDVVTSRAVAPLPILLELCLPFLKIGGRFLAMKGPEVRSELTESLFALQELGGQNYDLRNYALPGGDERCVVRADKYYATPATYPRRPKVIKRSPL